MAKKIASLYAEITGDATKLIKSLNDGKSKLGQFKNGLNDTVQQVTGFNLSQIGMAAAIGGAAMVAKKAFTDYQNYALAVGKSASAVGLNSDAMSRFIQVADDVRITQEQLTGAFAMATKNGYEMNIDNLANLADRLQDIQSPTERAAILTKMFGRNWSELNPLLEMGGDKLREMYGAVDDGLIVTDEAVQKSKDLYTAQDELGDAVKAAGNSFAKEFTPAVIAGLNELIKFISTMKEGVETAGILINWNKNLDAAFVSTKTKIYDTAESYDEYVGKAINVGVASGRISEAQAKEAAHWRTWPAMLAAVTSWLDLVSESSYNLRDSAAESDARLMQWGLGLNTMSQETLPTAASAVWNLNSAMEDMREESEGIASAQNNMITATQNLQQAQQDWQKGAGSDVVRSLEEAGIKGDLFNQAILGIDSTYGTTYQQQAEYAADVKALVDDYKRGGDVEAFKKGLDDLKTKYMNADEKVKLMQEHLATSEQILQRLTSKEWVINIRENYISAGSATGSSGSNIGNNQGVQGTYGKNSDGSPDNDGVKSNSTAVGGLTTNATWTGENGPELVVGRRGSYVLSNKDAMSAVKGDGIVVNMYMTGYGQTPNPQVLGATVAREIQRRM